MTGRTLAIFWAIIILAAAWIAKSQGASDATSFAIIAGLSAVAVSAIARRRRGRSGCA